MYNPQIETFICVVECGSFTKAAEKLFISPTAVMKQINLLEDRFNLILFDRSNHGLRLTKAGESVYQDAKYIVDYSKRAINKAQEIDIQKKLQSIRIGTSIMTPAKFLLDIWGEVQLAYPNLKIELIPFDNNPINSVEILKNLGQHIDIVGGLYDENFLQERKCNAAFLYDKKLMLAIPLTHSLSNKAEIFEEDLAGQNVMFIHKGWNKYIDNLRERLEKNNAKIIDFDMFNITAFNDAVKNNMPIITIEGWEDVHPLLKFVPSHFDCKIPFGILYSLNPSKQVQNFIETLQQITKR